MLGNLHLVRPALSVCLNVDCWCIIAVSSLDRDDIKRPLGNN